MSIQIIEERDHVVEVTHISLSKLPPARIANRKTDSRFFNGVLLGAKWTFARYRSPFLIELLSASKDNLSNLAHIDQKLVSLGD